MFSTPEEDEMGSPQPSAGAMEIGRILANKFVKDEHHFEHWGEMLDWDKFQMEAACMIDAYAAAALTDEQRDVWRSTKDEQPPEGEWVFWWMPISEEVLHGARTGGWAHGDGWDEAVEDLSHWRRIAPPNLS